MQQMASWMERNIAPVLLKISENKYLCAVRAGMVATAPFTIIGSFFIILTFLPIPGWDKIIGPYENLLQIPVTATFGMLGLIVSFAIAYDYAKSEGLEAVVSGLLSAILFIMIQINKDDLSLSMSNLGASGLFTGIIIAFLTVEIQKFYLKRNLVIKLPDSVPPIVFQSFLSLTPTLFLILFLWIVRFILGVDINEIITMIFKPLVFALNTFVGVMLHMFSITLLWSVGINGDNALDPIVAPIYLKYLADNVSAMAAGQPLPFIAASGFTSTFANVGGTGATLGLVIIMLFSREAGYKRIGRMAFIPSVFQINEPVFYGVPIVLNPIFMIPYIFNALMLTGSTYILMYINIIGRPIVNVPWTTPPVIGHYLVTGGDWRAAVWGVVSLAIATLIYYPFFKIAEKQRLQAEALGKAHE